MEIQENIPLKDHSTMRLGGTARYLATITSEEELLQAYKFARQHGLPFKVIGKGSNIIWGDGGFDGLIIVNDLRGFSIDGEVVTIAAGEPWDAAVERTVQAGLSGIELLSLIPGTTGATPVQNVGAYGREISDVLVSVQAFDTRSGTMCSIPNDACAFGYRTSRFKTVDAGVFIITSIQLKLSTTALAAPFYESLQRYLTDHGITDYSPHSIRKAVIAVRSSKLPDPNQVANNGSFFSNPVIALDTFHALQQRYPDIKGWEYDGKMKVAAGWLIENAGFKDMHDLATGMATWGTQSLVLVNETAHSTSDVLAFKDRIVKAVMDKFGILLEQEPELV